MQTKVCNKCLVFNMSQTTNRILSDVTDKITAGNYQTPEELFVRPDEMLFLTCSDPQVYRVL